MTVSTWETFYKKFPDFSLYSTDDPFIPNNKLIMIYLDEDFCLLQQLFNLKNSGFYF